MVGGKCTVLGCTFTQNTASFYATAVIASGSHAVASIERTHFSLFHGSTAVVYAQLHGAVYIKACEFDNRSFANNAIVTAGASGTITCSSTCPEGSDGICSQIGCSGCLCYSCECNDKPPRPPSLTPSPPPTMSVSHHRSDGTLTLLVAVLCGTALSLAFFVCCCWRSLRERWRDKYRALDSPGEQLLSRNADDIELSGSLNRSVFDETRPARDPSPPTAIPASRLGRSPSARAERSIQK